MADANIDKLRDLLNGYRNTALLYTAARLGIPQALHGKQRTAAHLAVELGVRAQPLHRLLRGLCVIGICEEHVAPDDGNDPTFSLTPLGETFLPGAEGGLHALAILTGEEYTASWLGLAQSARTGVTAFEQVFSMGVWEHRREHPELNDCFNSWLEEATRGVTDSILGAYDFSRFQTVVDVGGGHGAFIARLLQVCPLARGVLFDLPQVLDSAETSLGRAGVAERCTFVAGDFFASIPVHAQAMILKSVLHDWDDDRCLQILRSCRNAMEGGERLLLIERMTPTRAVENAMVTMLDLHMMAVTGGCERSEDEYRQLLEATGFRLVRRCDASTGFSILEAAPVVPPQ